MYGIHTLVRKKTTRDIAKMSFKIQLLVTTHRITMASDIGPRAHPTGGVRALYYNQKAVHTENRDGAENWDFNVPVVFEGSPVVEIGVD